MSRLSTSSQRYDSEHSDNKSSKGFHAVTSNFSKCQLKDNNFLLFDKRFEVESAFV